MRLPRTAATACFRVIGCGPRFAHPGFVLSGIETFVAFMILLGVLLKPLVDKGV